MRVRLLYFASLRDAAGRDQEMFDVPSGSLASLYDRARERHGFALARDRLRVARNGEFAAWSDEISDNDEIAFIPPVSGG